MKAVFFDLDGTLCNTLSDLTASLNYALRTFDLPTFGEDSVRMMVGDGTDALILRAVPRERAQLRPLVRNLYRAHYQRFCTEKTVPYDGMPGTVSELKRRGYALGVLTNKPHASAERIVSTLFPNDGADFAIIQGQSERFPTKPDPALLHWASERIGIPLSDFVYIGDSDVDIRFAAAAGIPLIGCSWGFRGEAFLREHGALRVIDHPKQLLEILPGGTE